jgi:uncharacterized protein
MTIALAVGGVAVGALAQSVTGFGFALLAGPVLVSILEPREAIAAMALLGMLVNVLSLTAARGRPEPLRAESVTLLLWAVPGLAAGAVALSRLPAEAVRVTVGVLVLAAVAQRRVGTASATLPAPAAGLTAGALTTSTGLSGPPLVLRLAGLGVSPRARRDTLAVVFLALGVFGVAALAAAGLMRIPPTFPALAAGAAGGALVGRRLADRVDPVVADRLTTVLLIAAAVLSIVSATVGSAHAAAGPRRGS